VERLWSGGMTRGEGAFFVKTAPSPLVLSHPRKNFLQVGAKVPVAVWRLFEIRHDIRPEGRGMLGSEGGRSVFFLSFSLVLASGALE
ncbi:hypothetical protein ACQRCJ_12225, partial [Desulfovibrio sp. SGI.102]|uniref:hypothetical protein n=1 Tax=Desulfovibrio sp. SGI.102 TaxID=3420559 RepID=UPI003D01CBBC